VNLFKLFKRRKKRPNLEDALKKEELRGMKFQRQFFDEAWRLELKRDKDAYVS